MMKTVKFLPYVLFIGLLIALAGSVGLGLAQGPEPPEEEMQPQGEVSIAATVGSKFSYQGVLKEGGSPVTGSRNMTFRYYSDGTCSTQVGWDMVQIGVPVTDGLFSVELAVGHHHFNGQGLWLEVEVGSTKIGCQEILPVPYALSLRPGARITGSGGFVHLVFQNVFGPPPPGGYGVYAEGDDYGVYGSGSTAAIYGDGDVKQGRADNGLVKAAVHVYCDGSWIPAGCARSFNNVNFSAISCFAAGPPAGRCTIDFNFDISDRYWVATGVGGGDKAVNCWLGSSSDQLDCRRFDASSGAANDGDIMVLVY